jgi:hypothetical protein
VRDIHLHATDSTATLAALVPRLTAAVSGHAFITEAMGI